MGTGPKGTSSKAAEQMASRWEDLFMFAREETSEYTEGASDETITGKE